MDRNEILANFQASTGIEDLGQCMAILEQCDWNFQSAVTSALPAHHPQSNTSTSAGQVLPGQMLTFSCTLGGTTRDITLDDSNTVGDLKQIASIELGITPDETVFEKWPAECAVAHPNDNTVLATMRLPHFNTLTVRQSILPGVSVGVDADSSPPLQFPCAAFGDDIAGLTRTYKVQIVNDENAQTITLDCEGSKTLRELKQDAENATKIPINLQNWSGFPKGDSSDNEVTLSSLNLNLPIHTLHLGRKPSKTIPTTNPFAALQNEHFTPFNNGSSSSHTAKASISSSDEEDIGDSFADDFFIDKKISLNKTISLMPEQAVDQIACQQQFKSEFLSRYGQSPDFYLDTLEAAIQSAFGCEARKRKPLAVYLHHDGSIQGNVFCSQLLANDSIIEFLNAHFVTWAWDLTSTFNRDVFLQSCPRLLGSSVADTVRRMDKDHFPLLVLAQGRGRSCDVTAIIQANTDIGELMARMLKAKEDADVQREQDIREEDARQMREAIKRQQEEAYLQSLQADRAKLEAQQEQILKQEEEERKKRMEEEKRQEEIKRLGTLVPPEPDPNCGEKISRVRFRAPDGSTFQRSFLASNTLNDLVNFIGSKGYHKEQYRILKSFPKVNLLSLPLDSTLESNGIFPQDSLIIEETPDYDV